MVLKYVEDLKDIKVEYNTSTSVHILIKDEYIFRTYKMINCKNYRIKSL